jgi:hypothetical protein
LQSQCSDCRVSAATIAGSGRQKPDADVNGGDKNAEKNIRGDEEGKSTEGGRAPVPEYLNTFDGLFRCKKLGNKLQEMDAKKE